MKICLYLINQLVGTRLILLTRVVPHVGRVVPHVGSVVYIYHKSVMKIYFLKIFRRNHPIPRL